MRNRLGLLLSVVLLAGACGSSELTLAEYAEKTEALVSEKLTPGDVFHGGVLHPG